MKYEKIVDVDKLKGKTVRDYKGVTQACLKKLFDYHEDGYLIWRENQGTQKVKGQRAGWVTKRGYSRISIKDVKFEAHRIIFLWHFGYLPASVDHKDRDPSNNRIENLRPACLATQAQNQRSRQGASSAYKGVSWNKRKKIFFVYIQANKKKHYLGTYKSEVAAAKAYDAKAKELQGEYAVLNFPGS